MRSITHSNATDRGTEEIADVVRNDQHVLKDAPAQAVNKRAAGAVGAEDMTGDAVHDGPSKKPRLNVPSEN
jgi:hypothetical protein